MQKAGLTDRMLCQAVSEISQGVVNGDLGRNLVKKRIALPGRGKRGGGRTIVATNHCDRWFFLYGFGKNERANIDRDEIKALLELAGQYLALDEEQIELAVHNSKFMEVNDDDDKM